MPGYVVNNPSGSAGSSTDLSGSGSGGSGRTSLGPVLYLPSSRRLDEALLRSSDPCLRLEAVRRLLPEDVPLGGWAALRHLGVEALDGRTGPDGATLLPISVCTGPVGRLRARSGLVVDRSTLLDVDVVEHDGVVVTAAERSCIDVMRRYGAEEGLAAADATVRAGLTAKERLAATLTRMSGLKGVPQARLAVSLVDGRSESLPESRLRYVWVVEAGLPVPLVNPVLVDRDGRFVARTDLLDPESGTVGEYDGSTHRELAQHTADNAREEDVEGLNLEVTRATSLDLWPHRRRLITRLQAAHRRGAGRDRSKDTWILRLP